VTYEASRFPAGSNLEAIVGTTKRNLCALRAVGAG